jgi:hypothetical protein
MVETDICGGLAGVPSRERQRLGAPHRFGIAFPDTAKLPPGVCTDGGSSREPVALRAGVIGDGAGKDLVVGEHRGVDCS